MLWSLMPFHKAKYFDLPGFKGALRKEEALHDCLWEAEWAFYSSFFGSTDSNRGPQKSPYRSPSAQWALHIFPGEKCCATFVPFVCTTRVGRANFSLDTVFIADDRTHMIDHNDPDYLKQMKRGQITWKLLNQTVLLSCPCYRSLTLATN